MRAIFAVVLIIGLLASTESLANAQQPKKIPQVGWIALFGRNSPNTRAAGPYKTAFMEGLRERGYIEGQNIIIRYRSADYQLAEGREDRLSKIAAELVRLNVDVIVADTNAATAAAVKATTRIPIVFLHGDPVWSGIVPNLAKPGRNVTGVSGVSGQLAGKRLEVLKEVFPKISRVGILLNVEAAAHRRELAEMQNVAEARGVELQALEFRYSNQDFEGLFQQAIRQRASAVLTLQGPIVNFHRRRIVDLAARNRLPAMYPVSAFTNSGGLMSYGVDSAHQYRRAAYFVDRILKGAKPSDLPVEQPTNFELAINLNTAKALGVTIPPKVLMWADRVISDGGQMPEKNAATTYSSDARSSAKIHRIGILAPGKFGRVMPADALRQELRNLGYVEGQNIAYEYQWADGNEDRLPALAAELLQRNVDILVSTSVRGARAAQQLTKSVPIVTIGMGDPVATGLVNSLHQPGRNLTGVSIMSPELGGKRLEVLKEIIPGISRVAVLSHTVKPAKEASIKEIETVARPLGVQLQIVNVKTSDEIETAFSSMLRDKADALTVLTQAMFVWKRNQTRIVELAAMSRLPAMYPRSDYVEAGGLISYGEDHLWVQRRTAHFVDKILKGAKPVDLPIEQPTKFELVINLNTAKTLGVTIPPKVLMWADRVIQ